MTSKSLPKLTRGMTVVFDGHSLTNRRVPGDMWTWPFLQLMAWDKCWSDFFSQLLFCWRPQYNLKFLNFAIGGSNSRGLVARAEKVAECQADLVLVTIGNNDAPAQISMDEYRSNLLGYVEPILAGGKAQIVFIGWSHFLPDPSKRPADYDQKLQSRVPYQTALQELAHSHPGVHYLDISKGFEEKVEALYAQSGEHTVYSDGSHYNNVGAYILAGEVLQAFGVVNAIGETVIK